MKDNISRRKLLAGIAGAGALGAAGGAGTWAYFTDEDEFSSLFESGSFGVSVEGQSLQFMDLDEQEVSQSTVTVCNVETLPVRSVILDGIEFEGSTAMAEALEVTGVTWAGNDVLGRVHNGDNNGNGRVDLHDVANYANNNAANLGGDGIDLATDDESGTKAECGDLVIETTMHYDNLSGEDTKEMRAYVGIVAEQAPVDSS